MALTYSNFLEDYPISHVLNQRIIGPIGNCQINPPSGSEIFVSRIPLHYTEVELFSIFSTVGNIFKLRIMLRECTSAYMFNRGFAYITYTTPEEAERAVNEITAQNNKYTGKYLTVELSHDNCRLFVGGIPEHKTKDEVWKQLLISGFEGIVEIIMYRAYTNRAVNRGYVFVEFETHQKAAQARYLFQNFKLWDSKLTVDWSTPLPRIDEVTLANITKLFFRNMSVTELPEQFNATLTRVLDGMPLRKVYKFKDYAFVHFYNRNEAEKAKKKLTAYYANSVVEISWATPQNMAPKKHYCTLPTPIKNSNIMSNKKSPQSGQSSSICESSSSSDHFQLLPRQLSPTPMKVCNPLLNNQPEQFDWTDFLHQSSPVNCFQQLHNQFSSTPINKTNRVINNGVVESEWPDFLSDSSSLDRYLQLPQCSTPINKSNLLFNNSSPQPEYASYSGQSSSSSVNYQQLFSPHYSPIPSQYGVDVMNHSPSYSSPTQPAILQRNPSTIQSLDYLHLVRPKSPIQTVSNGMNIENSSFIDSGFCSHSEQLNLSAIKDEYLPLDQVFRTLAISTNVMTSNDSKMPTFSNESGIQS
nr:uncharacterized protein LOC111416786 [Onthophagus taurus]